MITTTAACKRSRRIRGFTLLEIMIATALSAMLLAACMSSAIFLMKSAYGSGNYADMNMQSRRTLEQFGREVRMGKLVTDPTTKSFTIAIPTSTVDQNITYSYDEKTKELWRISGTEKTRMLTDVEKVIFRYFNIKNAETTLPLEIKHLQMEASMVRHVLQTSNTDHLISARFTLRNRYIGQ